MQVFAIAFLHAIIFWPNIIPLTVQHKEFSFTSFRITSQDYLGLSVASGRFGYLHFAIQNIDKVEQQLSHVCVSFVDATKYTPFSKSHLYYVSSLE